jgi:hypothetical protein
MSENLQVRDYIVKPGEKKFQFLKVGETPISPVEIPLGLINGYDKGPTLCVTAGVHPAEYPGIEAAIRLYKNTDPKKLKGKLLIVPVVNMPGFAIGAAYVNPIDDINTGRAFPGDKNGSITYQIAYTISDELISKSDCRLDLHGGDAPELLMHPGFPIYRTTGVKSVDETAEAVAKAYGTKYVWCHDTPPEKPFTDWRAQVPSITLESGGLGQYEEKWIKVHTEGIDSIMKYFGMLEGEPIKRDDQVKVTKTADLRVKRGGIFYPEAKPGDIVKKGQKLGEIRDLKGETLEELISPVDGIVRIYF